MEQPEERQQRITLSVEGTPLGLIVPASQERYYRYAAEELALTIGIYRTRYPERNGIPPYAHLLMAAVDVAYRSKLWSESLSLRGLAERLEALAERAEAVWLQHEADLRAFEGAE